MKQVLVAYERCMGCKSCEWACFIEHSVSKVLPDALFENLISKPRIRVEPSNGYAFPIRCQHCEDAPCIRACPTGAMHRDAFQAVVVDEDQCIGCFMCGLVCPFGAIASYRTPAVALKCDFCPDRRKAGLQPACVEACPTQALLYGDDQDFARQKRLDYVSQTVAAIEPTDQPLLALWRAGK
jgi:carbon-monoxide dehydrogenase iron sulfur subunit